MSVVEKDTEEPEYESGVVDETFEDDNKKRGLPVGPPRQWIIDRVDGNSKLGDSHPPATCCRVPPCVKWCPSCLEQNCCCEFVGRIGCVRDNTRRRVLLMRIGLASNLIGMALTIVSCFAISTDFNILKALSFSVGKVTRSTSREEFDWINGVTNLYLGLRAVAATDDSGIETVVDFSNFCDDVRSAVTRSEQARSEQDLGSRAYVSADECASCDEISAGLVGTLIISCVTYLPSLFTNILRMYPNYDVNCQKFFGVFMTLFSMVMSLYTILGYKNGCFDTFYEGQVYIKELPGLGQVDLFLDHDWKAGAGLFCLVVATGLKGVDAFCHSLLIVPSIARNREEQQEYEKLNN